MAKFNKESLNKLNSVINGKLNSCNLDLNTVFTNHIENNPNVKNHYISFIWTVWHSLDSVSKNLIMDLSSIPCVGGYHDVTDACIETLLKKAIPQNKL